MTLLLNDDEIGQLLTMELCLRVLDDAYREHGQGRAVNAAITQILMPTRANYSHATPPVYHRLRSMPGAIESLRMCSIRVQSQLAQWREHRGDLRMETIPPAPGAGFVGFLLMFDLDTTELLAIIPDGVAQAMRVGGTCGLGAKYLARSDSEVLGLLGSGWQARTHLLALDQVCHLRAARVFSPNPESRQAFVTQMQSEVECELSPVDSAEEAVRGADLIVSTTNTLGATVRGDWLEPGMYVSTVRELELDDEAWKRANVIVASRKGPLWTDFTLEGEVQRIREFREEGGEGKNTVDVWGTERVPVDWASIPTLGEVIVGRAKGRTDDKEIVYFDNKGDGMQLTAVGAALIREARATGLGREIPVDWFVQRHQ
jgi:alanine dehydrogenase